MISFGGELDFFIVSKSNRVGFILLEIILLAPRSILRYDPKLFNHFCQSIYQFLLAGHPSPPLPFLQNRQLTYRRENIPRHFFKQQISMPHFIELAREYSQTCYKDLVCISSHKARAQTGPNMVPYGPI